VKIFPADTLPRNWKESPAPAESAAIGDAWASAGTSAVLALPSVIVETEMNYLLNPAHSDFKRITLGIPRPYPFDTRLRR
jgi:RES domain-containing protein